LIGVGFDLEFAQVAEVDSHDVGSVVDVGAVEVALGRLCCNGVFHFDQDLLRASAAVSVVVGFFEHDDSLDSTMPLKQVPELMDSNWELLFLNNNMQNSFFIVILSGIRALVPCAEITCTLVIGREPRSNVIHLLKFSLSSASIRVSVKLLSISVHVSVLGSVGVVCTTRSSSSGISILKIVVTSGPDLKFTVSRVLQSFTELLLLVVVVNVREFLVLRVLNVDGVSSDVGWVFSVLVDEFDGVFQGFHFEEGLARFSHHQKVLDWAEVEAHFDDFSFEVLVLGVVWVVVVVRQRQVSEVDDSGGRVFLFCSIFHVSGIFDLVLACTSVGCNRRSLLSLILGSHHTSLVVFDYSFISVNSLIVIHLIHSFNL
jgi:hypothetical protein